jgi:hypothetical protein
MNRFCEVLYRFVNSKSVVPCEHQFGKTCITCPDAYETLNCTRKLR